VAPPVPPRRTLVLGGARSGKSAEAERRLLGEPAVVYAATAATRPDDAEWRERVRLHQLRRPSGWETRETRAVAHLLAEPDPRPLLVDCLSLWLTAVIDESDAWDDRNRLPFVREQVDALVTAWRRTARRVVGVTAEVGHGVVPPTHSGRLFRDELGRLNALVAAESERVVHVVAGRVTLL
jgi:adenosylcobinamide kinase/adenosylcobinamide-phosphate guanylyltransferase